MSIKEKETSKQSFSIVRRLKSFGYAFNGLKHAVFTQHNMWIHLIAVVLVVLFAFLLKVSPTECLLLVFAIGLVISAEIFNSAIELLTDLVNPEKHPKAGLVKDLAAGAVLVAATTAFIIGLLIFAPKIFAIL